MTTIKSIRLQNFKGVKLAEYNFDGKTATIKGQNGAGKTTIADAYFWVMADKNYALASNPNIRPIGAEEVTPRVEIVFDIDRKDVTVAKIQKCTVKKSKTGGADTVSLSNSYEVNSVEYGERDFKKKMQEYGFDFDLFLSLSHPDVFAGQKADEMRKVLFGMASEKTDKEIANLIEGAEEVADMLANYTAEEIKAMQNATLRKIKEEYGKDGEILRAKIEGMEQTKTDIDVAELELLKNSLNEKIAENKAKQDDISKQLEEYEKLSSGLLDLQFELSDLQRKAGEELAKKKRELRLQIETRKSALSDTECEIQKNNRKIEGYEQDVEKLTKERDGLHEEWKKVNEEKFDEQTAICPTCRRELPQEERKRLLAEFEKSKDDRIAAINVKGFEINKEIADAKEKIQTLQDCNDDNACDKKRLETDIADLEKQLSELPESVDVSDISEAQEIKRQIAEKEESMKNCNGAEDIRQNLRDELNDLQNQLVEVEKKFALAKKNMEIDDSIAELRQKQGEYEQNRANAEKILDQLKDVVRKKVEMVTDEINRHFDIVKWKLFDFQKNGEYKDCCVPLIDGKRFGESTNTGREILAKLDIIKGLQRFYGQNYPIFLDGAECLSEETMSRIDMDCQIIYLSVSEDKELRIEVTRMNDHYIVEKEFEHAGYKCVVTFGDMGHRCGYVGIPSAHTLFGKSYSDYLDIKKEDIGDKEVSGIIPLFCACLDNDERIKIDAYFQCHGGITYSGGGEKSEYPIESDLWWFGFDCAHAGDGKELQYALWKFPKYKKEIEHRMEIERMFPEKSEIVRTQEDVVNECKRLAEQLKDFEKE